MCGQQVVPLTRIENIHTQYFWSREWKISKVLEINNNFSLIYWISLILLTFNCKVQCVVYLKNYSERLIFFPITSKNSKIVSYLIKFFKFWQGQRFVSSVSLTFLFSLRLIACLTRWDRGKDSSWKNELGWLLFKSTLGRCEFHIDGFVNFVP